MRYGMEFLLAHCRIVIDLRKKEEKEKNTLYNSAFSQNLIELSKERIKMSLCLMCKHLADNKRPRPKEIACHDSLKKKSQKSHHLALDQWITTDWANNRSS